MDYKTLKKLHQKCCQLVTDKQLSEAFPLLIKLTSISRNSDLSNQLETYRETYKNILTFSFGAYEDPEKDNIYHHLLRNLLDLADKTYEAVITEQTLLQYSFLKSGNDKLAFNNIESLIGDEETDHWTKEASLEEKSIKTYQTNRTNLFYHLWLTDKYQETQISLVKDAIHSEKLKWWDKCLIISALTLSLQRYFDETKFELLHEAFDASEHQIWQRALVGIIITLYQYNNRLYLYPTIKRNIENSAQSANFQKQIELVIIQFIKSKDTEKIAQKFRDEIIPEMTKIHSRISDKLDLKNLIIDPISEEKNPDWEHVFHDSPDLLNKLEELSMLQMEGSDVFMGTFSMLKNFDFFNDLNNWFLPYYKENQLIRFDKSDEAGTFDLDKFTENMEKSHIMCNSDKYSFTLNMQYMPVKEKTMMVEMFNMEANTMGELANDDELLKKPSYERIVFTQYIQDFYRFNKLFERKQEFYDIFSTRTDFHNSAFFNWLITNKEIIRNIGEFYFEKEYYADAIEIFNILDTEPANFELWQKIAYGWQKIGDLEKALQYYLKADLAELRKPWNIKKIAFCYKRSGNFTKALDYYLEAEKLEPENLQLQANLAHTYLELKDYENALKKYFKVEYLAPDNHKIQRPIAWCSFMLGKFDTAKKYFEKILVTEGNQHDLLNLGHIEWCLGNKKQAIERYKECLAKSEFNKTWFNEEFFADSEILIRYGIESIDIPLMRDYILFD